MYTYLSLELFYELFYSFLFVSVGCHLRLYELQMTTTRKKSNKYGNWRVGKHFTAGLCDYWNWFHSPGFWLKTKFYIVLMTKIFCSIYWKVSKLFEALKCQLFKHSKKKSNRWYKAVIIILPVLSPPPPPKVSMIWGDESGNVSIISNWKLKLYIKYSHISKFSRYKSMPSKPDDIEICGNV